jgi:deoxyribodipyrimidine photo-lyase
VATSVVVFTRDLRVTDHPALDAAARAGPVVPLFVFDESILTSAFNRPNRTGFLVEALADLADALRDLGAALVVRRGDWTTEVMRCVHERRATAVHVSADVSAHAARRRDALTRACDAARVEITWHDGNTVVPPGALVPGSGADHYQVFTPYYRRWSGAPRRPVLPPPARLTLPPGVDADPVPPVEDIVAGARSPAVPRGGLVAARARLHAWIGEVAGYDAARDDLAADATSRLSPYLHFGCVSPLEVLVAAEQAAGSAGAGPFARQLCWRDFFAQVLAARPDAAWSDYRHRSDRWREDPVALRAWTEGRTGYPVVDAGMRQLAAEGFVHNRARMIVASFLTKDLGLDWRLGARHFLDLLVDGDLANNNLNWQWVAGTGTDTNPHRVLNPTVQGGRFDPDGAYVRRHVPELAALRGPATHDPDDAVRRACGYPPPIVDHHTAVAAYRDRLTARG